MIAKKTKKIKETILPTGSRPLGPMPKPANVIDFPTHLIRPSSYYETDAQVIYVDFVNKKRIAA